jgi:hypothetical protein
VPSTQFNNNLTMGVDVSVESDGLFMMVYLFWLSVVLL